MSAKYAFAMVGLAVGGMIVGNAVTMTAVKNELTQHFQSQNFQNQQKSKYIISDDHNHAINHGSVTKEHRNASLEKAIENMCEYEADTLPKSNQSVYVCVEKTKKELLTLAR